MSPGFTRSLAVLVFWIVMVMLAGTSLAAQGKGTSTGPVRIWEKNPVFQQTLKTRPFDYGFTTWPFAVPPQAQADLMNIIAANSTMYTEQFDDALPWNAALYNTAYPRKFVQDINNKLARRLTDRPLLLSLNPLNTDRSAVVDNITGQLPKELRGKPMDDPAFIRAYTNYCIWMIDRFQPDYVLSVVESNDLLKESPADWPAFDRFSRAVMAALKVRYPDILFGESLTLHTFMDKEGPGPTQAYRDTIKAHVQMFDFIGISYYPLFSGPPSVSQWDDAFTFIRGWTNKPLAVTESGHPAEPLVLKDFNVTLPFTAQDQADFVCTMLRHATTGNYLFVIWWSARDIDKLMSIFPSELLKLARVFRDMGLEDENGKARKAFDVWRGNTPDCNW